MRYGTRPRRRRPVWSLHTREKYDSSRHKFPNQNKTPHYVQILQGRRTLHWPINVQGFEECRALRQRRKSCSCGNLAVWLTCQVPYNSTILTDPDRLAVLFHQKEAPMISLVQYHEHLCRDYEETTQYRDRKFRLPPRQWRQKFLQAMNRENNEKGNRKVSMLSTGTYCWLRTDTWCSHVDHRRDWRCSFVHDVWISSPLLYTPKTLNDSFHYSIWSVMLVDMWWALAQSLSIWYHRPCKTLAIYLPCPPFDNVWVHSQSDNRNCSWAHGGKLISPTRRTS